MKTIEQELQYQLQKTTKSNKRLKQNIKELNFELNFHMLFNILIGAAIMCIGTIGYFCEVFEVSSAHWFMIHISDLFICGGILVLSPIFCCFTTALITNFLYNIKR